MSTTGQKDDFTRQVGLLESFYTAQGWTYEGLADVGSGLNYQSVDCDNSLTVPVQARLDDWYSATRTEYFVLGQS